MYSERAAGQNMRKEWMARLVAGVLLLAALAVPALAWQQRSQGMVMHARMAENGGWTPDSLRVAVGQPLHLRLTSDDVAHGFAIGQSDLPAVDVLPGEITEITLVFDKPGKYTFYCTRWCSVNHWRMRGVIEVSGPATPEAARPPLYVTLGLDIDAEHHADILPAQIPSAWRGALLQHSLPAAYRSREYYLTHSPLELWKALRAEAVSWQLTDLEIWDLVAWVWQANTSAAEIAEGQRLYAANCAACHGETGRGDGVFAAELARAEAEAHAGMRTGERTTRPTDFTAPEHLLAASPAHLQGKIIRGGMGTGMPYWGPIFTEDQTWALVAYLWTFQFKMEK